MKRIYRCIYWMVWANLIFQLVCTAQNKPQVEKQSVHKEPWRDPMFFLEGQLCQHIRCMHQDKDGQLWFGTNVYGLIRYDGDTLIYFDEKDGLGKGRISGFDEDPEGILWMATYGGLSRYDGEVFSNYTDKDGLVHSYVSCLNRSRDGRLWLGTLEGISIFDGKNFTNFAVPQVAIEDTTSILSYRMIKSILEDRNGCIWIGTDGFGLWMYDPKKDLRLKKDSITTVSASGFRHFSKKNGLSDNNISDLFEDSKGNIWVGTMFGGVSILHAKDFDSTRGNLTFTNYADTGKIKGVEVSGFYEDEVGNVWFAVENAGVYRFDGTEFYNYYENYKLPTNGILCMMKDREERFWLGGWGGLFQFDGNIIKHMSKSDLINRDKQG